MEMLEARDAATRAGNPCGAAPGRDGDRHQPARHLRLRARPSPGSRDPGARILMFSMNDDSMFAAQAIEVRRARLLQQERRSAGFSHRNPRGLCAAAIRWRRKWPRRSPFCASAPERRGIADAARTRGVAAARQGQEHVGDRCSHQRLLQDRGDDLCLAAHQIQRPHSDAAHPHCGRAEDRLTPRGSALAQTAPAVTESPNA